MAEKDSDLKKIMKLIEIMKDNGLEEIEINHGDDKIFLKRSQPQQPAIGIPMIRPESVIAPAGPESAGAVSQPSAPQAVPIEENLVEIKSPIVGTFYEIGSIQGHFGIILLYRLHQCNFIVFRF